MRPTISPGSCWTGCSFYPAEEDRQFLALRERNSVMKEAVNHLEAYSSEEGFRRMFEEEKRERDRISREAFVRSEAAKEAKMKAAKAVGEAEKAVEEAKKEAKEAREEKLKNAMALLQKGVSEQLVQECLKLTDEQMRKIVEKTTQ